MCQQGKQTYNIWQWEWCTEVSDSSTHVRNLWNFYKSSDFYCVENNIRPSKGDNCKKALFLTLLGQATFAKLKVMVSPKPVGELSMERILECLTKQLYLRINQRYSYCPR